MGKQNKNTSAMPQKEKPERKKSPKKTCMSCPAEVADKPIGKFYKSYSPIHADGYIPMCKDCLVDRCFSTETQDVDVEVTNSYK